jgi:hypothetical protein
VEADAVRAAWIASLLEESVGLGGVVVVLVGGSGPGPVFRRKKTFGDTRLASVECLDDERPVDGIGDGSTDALVAKNGVAEIEDDVVEDGARSVFDGEVRVASEGVDFVGAEGVAFDVG